jgi:hypothetical protein
MGDLKEFAERMNELGQNVADNADKLVRDVAMAVDAVVVVSTPIRTGRARANWQPALDQIPTGVRYPSPLKPPTPDSGAQESIDTARDVISQYKAGQTIHITNNLPYIKKLNEGSSDFAPAGFVEKAVVAAKGVIDGSRSVLTNVTTEKI